MPVSVGGGGAVMLKLTAPLVPAGVVMVTFCGPVAALAPMAKVAVTCVALTTARFDTVIPGPALIFVPNKFVPARLTFTAAPWVPDAGVMEVSVGGSAAAIVKTIAPLVPPAAVTITFRVPGVAAGSIARVAVTCVGL